MKHVPSPNSIAVDHCNNRLWQFSYPFVQIQYIESRYTIFSYIAPYPFNVLISSTTKGFVSSPGNDNHIDIISFTTNLHSVQHLNVCFWTKGIVHFWAVDCNFSYSFAKFKKNVTISSYGFPTSHLHIFLT